MTDLNLTTLTDDQLASAYLAACAAEVRHADEADELARAERRTNGLVWEIHRRWDEGRGPHLSI